MASTTEKKRHGFKLPHLLWIILGLILLMSILTYVIPAGEFEKDEKGNLIGTAFHYLGYQTPINPWQAAMMMLDGLSGSVTIIMLVMISGATIGVILDSGAIDDFLNWAVYKLKDKGANVLIPVLFIIMVYLGGFGGSDAFVALVPIGVLFAKKLNLDPIVALGVTTFATLIGFGTGPTKQLIPQTMMGLPAYSGFGMRLLIMTFYMLVGLILLMRYVRKIQKDPSASAMGNTDWLQKGEFDAVIEIKEERLSWKTVAILVIFIGQYLLMVWHGMVDPSTTYPFNFAVHLLAALACGVLSGLSADGIGSSFAKGFSSMAFVGFIIGMARVVSLVMTQGHIMHTIVYVLTRPLMNIPHGITLIGLVVIISIINLIIPSASSKAAILVPIIFPITQALGIHPQLAVQAFQFGDGFTNLVSPALGWTMGSLDTAKVPYDRWLKWVLPKVILMIVLSFPWIYVLEAIGWTGL